MHTHTYTHSYKYVSEKKKIVKEKRRQKILNDFKIELQIMNN